MRGKRRKHARNKANEMLEEAGVEMMVDEDQVG